MNGGDGRRRQVPGADADRLCWVGLAGVGVGVGAGRFSWAIPDIAVAGGRRGTYGAAGHNLRPFARICFSRKGNPQIDESFIAKSC